MKKRSNVLSIKLTNEERAKLDKMAWRKRLATSTFVRSMLLSDDEAQEVEAIQHEEAMRAADEGRER